MYNSSNYELSPEYEQSSFEYSNEYSNELFNENSNEYAGETGYELSPEWESASFENENFEMQFSNELLELSNEYEFADWLKRLAQRGAGAAVGFLNSPSGQQAVSSLSNIAQKTLSGLGQHAGSWLGQRAGAAIGGSLGNQVAQYGSQAGQQLGQMAADRVPAFVKFASNTLQNLAGEMRIGKRPNFRSSMTRAASKHYPMILKVRGILYGRQSPDQSGRNQWDETDDEMFNESLYETSNNESPFNEINEMELASELLAVQNEQELDRFLGKLFKKVTGAVSNFAKSSTGKALGGILKTVAGKALPVVGGAIGTALLPGVGTAIGSSLGSAAGNLFGLELEGLSSEDKEFETAKGFVRFAGSAIRSASRMRNVPPANAARTAVINTAKVFAPGIIRPRRFRPRYQNRYYPAPNYYYSPYPVYGGYPPPPVGYPIPPAGINPLQPPYPLAPGSAPEPGPGGDNMMNTEPNNDASMNPPAASAAAEYSNMNEYFGNW